MSFIAPQERRSRVIRIRWVALLAVLLVNPAVATLLGNPPLADAEEIASIPSEWLAPTATGAPFLPSPRNTSPVLKRAELLTRRDDVRAARASLRGRSNATGTVRILDSERVAIDREIEEVETSDLPSLTEEFGIDVGVFPVAELRKPFKNDWNDPRSGGRRHQGTDLLAQIGVPLMAIEDGTHERTTQGGLGGLSVYLLGDSGARYYYAHLDEAEDFVEGQRVHAGQVIGTVGDSGNAKGSPHLHLQWAPDGETGWANPYPLLAELYGDGVLSSGPAFGPTGVQP